MRLTLDFGGTNNPVILLAEALVPVERDLITGEPEVETGGELDWFRIEGSPSPRKDRIFFFPFWL